MTYPAFNSGDILTASDMNAVGLWKIAPTSVTGGTLINNVITIGNAVSSVSVNGAFNATFNNYLIAISGVTVTQSGNVLGFRLRASGTDSSTGYYGNTFFIATGAAGSLSNANSVNGSYAEVMSVGTASINSASFNVFAPVSSEWTRVRFDTSADTSYFRLGSYIHQVSTSYDGFTLFPGGGLGTMTGGNITIYGYKK